MCHGCGGCFAVCPKKALSRGARILGELETGVTLGGKHSFIMGRARIGEAMSTPQLRELHKYLNNLSSNGEDVLIDAPPGVSCPAMTAARDVDVILLVAEPTPFGFHDFKLACQAFGHLKKPLPVVLNRAGIPGNQQGDNELKEYCQQTGLPVLTELPFDRDAARHYAQGLVLASLSSTWNERFTALRNALQDFWYREHINA